MTTTAKKKTKATIRSTDRGGAVLLPLGVVLIALGMMMLISLVAQTSSASLSFFKNMTIGLGGSLAILMPFFTAWLGALLVVSSKRYVSYYRFVIGLLLYVCIGALMISTQSLTTDRNKMLLMDKIKDVSSINAAYPHAGINTYLSSAFSNYVNVYPAGTGSFMPAGALSMLLAYPLYATLGSFGATTVLVLMLIALGFAFVRVSPTRLIAMMSERQHQGVPSQKQARAQVQPTTQAREHPVQVYPEDLEPLTQPQTVGSQEIQPGPQWPAQQSAQTTWFEPQGGFAASSMQAQQQVEPGFIRQDHDRMFEQYQGQSQQPVYKPAQPTAPVQQQKQTQNSEFYQPEVITEKPVAEPERASVKRRRARRQEEDTHQTETAHQALPWEDKLASEPVQQTSTRETARVEQETTPVREEKMPEPRAQNPHKHIDTAKETAPKPVGIAPAVELTGKRIPVKPALETGLDNMAKKPEPSQIRLAFDDYGTPPLRLLTEGPKGEQDDTTEEDRIRAEKLIETLKSFSITAHLHDIVHGPTVTRFAIRLAEGVNVSKLRNVMDNLTIELKAKGDIRAEMPIPGTSFVGLEVSNDKTSKVFLRDVLESPRMSENRSPTAVALGRDITGTPIVCELMDMPHLLIAGATGSGKSVCINSIICSMLYRASPRNVRLIMVDPKFVELQPYNDVPHLMMPVITDAKKATAALEWVCQEMDRRYQVLVDAGVRNLDAYNKKLGPDEDPLPRIIVIVDEMADLMTTSGKMIEDHIKRITAKARAAGICLILATQRPSVNIITGVIKANIPGRIAFRVSSPFDSKTILDSQGAEKLLGYGDMLYRSQTRDPIRVQGCFVSDHDVEQTVGYIRSRNKADYDLDLVEFVEQTDQPENGNGNGDNLEGGDAEFDELLPQAIEMAVEAGQMSISMLQRVLRVGYARSGRLIDEMARRGIISGNEGTKARKTLMTREQYMNYLEQGY